MPAFWPLVTLLFGCPAEDTGTYERFNAESDVVEVGVTASTELGGPVEGALNSTTGEVEVGRVIVDPGSGPVGTEHLVRVEVDDTYEETVERVTLEADAGERGTETITLRQDSADHGLWVVTVESRGEEGEERTDTFAVQLWTIAGESSSGDTDE